MDFFGSWSVLTTNFLIVLYVAISGMMLSSILVLVNAQWRYQIRGYINTFNTLLPIAFILLLILLYEGESTFQWLGNDTYDHLSGWHDYRFLVIREISGFLIISTCCIYFRLMQSKVDVEGSSRHEKNLKVIAIIMPFVYVLYTTMIAWDFEMTMIPGWHSASYAAYHFVSNFHGFLAFFSIFLIYLKLSKKAIKPYDARIFNYMAQLLLGFTILWIYFYFSQYLIVWYGRLPEEINRFNSMMHESLGFLWTLFIFLKFVIPCTFLAVMKSARNNPLFIAVLSICIIAGTWLERYIWISGSVDSRYYHIPMTDTFDIAVTLTIAFICWFTVNLALKRSGLIK